MLENGSNLRLSQGPAVTINVILSLSKSQSAMLAFERVTEHARIRLESSSPEKLGTAGMLQSLAQRAATRRPKCHSRKVVLRLLRQSLR